MLLLGKTLSFCSLPGLASQMVGIGTSDVNLDKYRHTFCSLLGKDEDSWGLSYTGDTGRVVAGWWRGSIRNKHFLRGLKNTLKGIEATRPVSPFVNDSQGRCRW